VTSSNVLTIVVHDPALSGGTESVNYTVQSSDTLASIATNLAAAITADTNLQSLGVNATASSNQITIKSTSANLTT
jgi:phage tail sheath gpL-like